VTNRLAIIAPTYRAARVEADERKLRDSEWFFVESERSVRGYSPGRYAIREQRDLGLSWDQRMAIQYMEGRGWRRRIASDR
jgi:hypothetical protein